MHTQTVSIPKRFCGPTRSGNGGYVCGVIAGQLEGTASVRLFAPPPLEAEMTLQVDADSAKLLHDEMLIGEARPATLELTPPTAPTLVLSQTKPASDRHEVYSESLRLHGTPL